MDYAAETNTPKSQQLNTKVCILLRLHAHPGLGRNAQVSSLSTIALGHEVTIWPPNLNAASLGAREKLCAKVCAGALKASSWRWVTHISSVTESCGLTSLQQGEVRSSHKPGRRESAGPGVEALTIPYFLDNKQHESNTAESSILANIHGQFKTQTNWNTAKEKTIRAKEAPVRGSERLREAWTLLKHWVQVCSASAKKPSPATGGHTALSSSPSAFRWHPLIILPNCLLHWVPSQTRLKVLQGQTVTQSMYYWAEYLGLGRWSKLCQTKHFPNLNGGNKLWKRKVCEIKQYS